MKKQNDAILSATKTKYRIQKAWLMVLLFCIALTGAFAQTQTFNATGSFVVPAGVTSVNVQVWGGGGAGGGNTTTNDGGGGGGGGAYSATNGIAVTPGASLTVTVGTGGTGGTGTGGNGSDSWFINNTTILAKGGNGGFAPASGAGGVFGTGGAAASGIGTTKFSGGAGGTGRDNGTGQGGPGGSSAGTAANGTTAPAVWSTITAAAAPSGGGQGGDGGNSTSNGEAASTPGGGGGGAGDKSIIGSNRSGGDGANGRVTITWTCAGYSLASTAVTSPLCVGSTSTVTLTGGTLPNGTYTVTYNSSAPNAATGVTASMTVTSGVGSFATAALANAGATTITITNISSGAVGGTCSSSIGANNTAVVTVNALATAVAGTAITTCSNAGAVNITAGSSASNNSGVQWTSSGTGTWTNDNSLTLAEYTPSGADITAGVVTLTLTSFGNSPCGNVTSNKTLTINTAPTVGAANICQGGSASLTASASCPTSIASATATGNNTTTFTFTNSSPVHNINMAVSGVPAGAIVTDVNVSVTIAHNYQGDVVLSLRAADGTTTVSLTGASGSGTTNNLGNTTGTITETSTGAVVVYTFDQAAATQAWGSSNPATAGSFRPASGGGNMNTFNGLTTSAINGNWTLIADDDGNGDNGLITAVSVSIQYTYPLAAVINWYTVPSGGNVVQTGSPFNPVGDAEVIAEGGAYANLTNSNTPGTYTFYAACSSTPTCREAVNFVIDQAATANAGSNQAVCVSVGSASLSGSFGGSATSATWSSAGDGSFDNTSNMNAVYTFGAADISNGSVLLTLTTNDPAGVCDAVSSTMTITINTAPTITSNGNLTLNTSGSCLAVVSNGQLLAQVSTTGSPAPSVTFSPIAGNFPVGTTTVTATAQNVCGTVQTTFDVIVTDNENPVISNCPGNINLNNDAGLCSAVATWTAPTAADNCSIQSFTSTHNSGDVFPVGTTTVTYTATDVNGNTATCSFNVVVTDNTNPVISNCPVNISINNDAALCTAIATWTAPTAADNCSIQSFLSTHNSGDAFPVGTTTVTYTATDVNGNTATCSFNVVVVDTEIPVIVNCPANITVSNDAGTCGAVVTYTAPTATDNCAGATISGSNNSGDTFPIGTTTVTYTATDASGNTATCSFTVTVNSTDPSAPASATTNAPFDNICNGNNVLLTANGGSLGSMGGDYKWYTGSCGGTLVGTGATITQSPVVTTTYFVRVEDNCGNSTACTSVTVTLSYAPDSANVILPFTGMPVNICTGTTATLSIAPVAGATQYTWDVPTGGYFNGNPLNVSPFTTATPTVQVTYGAPIASLYSTGVQAGNACGNSIRKGQKTRGTTSVPANVSGPLTACANTSNTYSTNVVQGATSYLWTITGNATVVGTGNTVTVNFGPSWNGGSLCVSAQTTCYTSPSKCITISKSAAVTNAITGTFTACPGSALSYSVAPSAGAASYNWTVPNHASVAGGQGTATANVAFSHNFNSAGNICVTVNSICGVASPAKCKTVAPGIPTIPNSISGPSNGLCNQTVVYTCPNQNGASFTWTAPLGAAILAGQGTNSVSIQYGSFSTGAVSVKASNACGNSGNRNITVKGAPNKPTSIVATPGSWCDNTQGIEFQANTSAITGSYTMSWSYPSSPTANYVLGGGNSSSIVLDWLTGNGVLMATAYNACGSGTAVLNAGSSCREAEVKNNEADKLTVYPNPTNGVVNVSYNADKGYTAVSVLDVAGRKVMSQSTTSVYGNNTVQLDMSKLAKGAYMLTIQNTQGLKQVKVVVE